MIHPTLLFISNFSNPLQFPINQANSQLKSSATNSKSSGKSNINRWFNLLHSKTEDNPKKPIILQSLGLCKCGRRHFLETITSTMLHASLPSLALDLEPNSSSMEMLNKIHPPRSDWYEEFYAAVLNNGMKEYEAEVAGYKSKLFDKSRGQAKDILEIGVGTGPNLKYYASDARVVFGIDPNRKMEKYAKGAAEAAGLSPDNFKFIQAVGESLPLADASVDAVIGTLVLCSVKDVHRTLQEVKRVLKPGGLYLFVEHVAANGTQPVSTDGTSARLLQNILNPLQQLLADGCHLTRETGTYISEAGFSSVNGSTGFISSALFINPHIYGIAHK